MQSRLGVSKCRILSLGAKLILIKHVLFSLPKYLLALIEPPKSVINDIIKLMSDFFWSDKDGQHRYHWVKWSSFCFPQNEGGIGLWSLDDIIMSYALKLRGRFREGNTFKPHILKLDIAQTVIQLRLNPYVASLTWKRMVEARSHSGQHIFWLVGKGNTFKDNDVLLMISNLPPL